MTSARAFRIAAFLGLLGVALGAMGAHAFKGVLEANQTTLLWERAIFFHLIHTVMLVVVANRAPFQVGPWFCFLAGILLFSGSLYVYATTKLGWITALTPCGGVSFLVAWCWLLVCPKS
jgi:uncharacterized membrane protein YgdD (TMEM256/DUF423 family)